MLCGKIQFEMSNKVCLTYRKNCVVLLLVAVEEGAQLLRGDSQDGLSLLLEAVEPLLPRHVAHAEAQDQAPVEVVPLRVALLTPIESILPIPQLEYTSTVKQKS